MTENHTSAIVCKAGMAKKITKGGNSMNLVFIMKIPSVVPRYFLRRLAMVYDPIDNAVSVC